MRSRRYKILSYRRGSGRLKYNNENIAFNLSFSKFDTNDYQVSLVESAAIAGVRKVVHMKLDLLFDAPAQAYAAVVYLPEGFKIDAQHLTIPSSVSEFKGSEPQPTFNIRTNCYQPSQNIMWFGSIRSDSGRCTINIPLSKNLNGGDQIILLVKPVGFNGDYHYDSKIITAGQSNITLTGVFTYAIAYR